MATVIEDILTQVRADIISTGLSGVSNVDIRNQELYRKADTLPRVIITYNEIASEPWETEEGRRRKYTYEVIILYAVASTKVGITTLTEANYELLRQLYYGPADLVVSGVTIEDVNLGSVTTRMRRLLPRSIEHYTVVYIVETVEL